MEVIENFLNWVMISFCCLKSAYVFSCAPSELCLLFRSFACQVELCLYSLHAISISQNFIFLSFTLSVPLGNWYRLSMLWLLWQQVLLQSASKVMFPHYFQYQYCFIPLFLWVSLNSIQWCCAGNREET